MRDILQQLFKKSDGTAIRMPACFVAVILFAAGSPQDTAASEPSAEPVYKVVSPIGESTVKMTTMAPRLDTLAGKTVCMVWNQRVQVRRDPPCHRGSTEKAIPGRQDCPVYRYANASLPEPPGTPRKESEALQALSKKKAAMQ